MSVVGCFVGRFQRSERSITLIGAENVPESDTAQAHTLTRNEKVVLRYVTGNCATESVKRERS